MRKLGISGKLEVGSWKLSFPLPASCFLLLLFLIPSCKLINPDTPIPSYIRVNNFNLTTDLATQGSNSCAITDVWVFVDGQIIGVFQMPVSVPIISSGAHNLILQAGVIVNGIAATRINYPFYTNYTQTVNLVPGTIDTIVTPTVSYVSSCTFSILENFDEAGTVFTEGPGSTDTLHIISDTSITMPGQGRCGAALLNATDSNFYFTNIDSFPMPQGSVQYMELNYKSNYPFTIGLQSYSDVQAVQTDILVLNPTNTWTKIYVDLTLASSQYPTATFFKIYMYSSLNLTVQPSAAIYFDNIKVIHNG